MAKSLDIFLKKLSESNQHNFINIIETIKDNRKNLSNREDLINELLKRPTSILNSRIQVEESPFLLVYTQLIYPILFIKEFLDLIRKEDK